MGNFSSSVSGRYRKIRDWVESNERRLSSGALVLGFIIDWITLNRIDQLYDNLVLLFYILVAALAILTVHLHEARVLGSVERQRKFVLRTVSYLHSWAPTVMQFAFGGLFSGFFIFYSRSGSIWASWPYMVILLLLLIGNEFLRKHYIRQTVHVTILYFAVFSYVIFSVPMLVGRIGASIFVLSGVVSVVIIYLFLYVLNCTASVRYQRSRKGIVAGITGVLFVVNGLYFTNILPPIPLSLKDAGVYHFIVRSDGEYTAYREDRRWYEYVRPYDVFQAVPGDTIYAFSSVFAPGDLQADIVHVWEYRDPQTREWVVSSRVPFTVRGGRVDGFRGYTLKENIFPGSWRIDIETLRGQLIGRINFRVERAQSEPDVHPVTL